ncbi:dihydrodipicolinate synthase family protein [Pseudorhodobacter turbinis]|uniref:Dihydrodipicolinate synthase family protein n=1 Tax=Pseudorhodobacter turbinis TaxID=2500533 RepID=A0A4P8EHL0_9RHOB|nr:dihydrodipicolinate synthase family protein [Pseudorhodobacter turbinis]QCO56055.1 dihydrodipicolinate synthase family protein [Pseudorhodobacter turbinis]
MGLHHSDLPKEIIALLRKGAVIPAHPLALDENREFDRRRQRALTRYYVDAGSGGLAVGVHTTQFAIRDIGLYEPVLKAAAEDAAAWADRPMVMIAGVAGQTEQAIAEAKIARSHGYHAVLVSMGALRGQSPEQLIAHCRAVAEEMPIIGFYMQSAVGGIDLDARFWREFSGIDNAVAIKMAPFNRYKTLDVMKGVVAAQAEDRITLYTGNDDHIVADLVTPFDIPRDGKAVRLRVRGGLLGHWSVWTRKAVELLDRVHSVVDSGADLPLDLAALDSRVTDCNAAFFDVANNFHGCIAGCHEVLRRQQLLETIHCLDPDEGLSPGQAEEIDRVYAAHPDLADDDFIADNLERWLA